MTARDGPWKPVGAGDDVALEALRVAVRSVKRDGGPVGPRSSHRDVGDLEEQRRATVQLRAAIRSLVTSVWP